MPIGYIYLPVGSGEMLEYAAVWNQERRRRGEPELPVIATTSSGTTKSVRRLFGGGNLRFVGTGDTLFVILHGTAEGSRLVGAERGGSKVRNSRGVEVWRGGTEKNWLPADFARHLEKEGLSKGFCDLRLLACGSALKGPNSDEPYAQTLWRELRKLGYARMEVVGYLGLVRFGTQHGLTVEYFGRDDAGELTNARAFVSGDEFSLKYT